MVLFSKMKGMFKGSTLWLYDKTMPRFGACLLKLQPKMRSVGFYRKNYSTPRPHSLSLQPKLSLEQPPAHQNCQISSCFLGFVALWWVVLWCDRVAGTFRVTFCLKFSGLLPQIKLQILLWILASCMFSQDLLHFLCISLRSKHLIDQLLKNGRETACLLQKEPVAQSFTLLL